jgi:hypothetical protein
LRAGDERHIFPARCYNAQFGQVGEGFSVAVCARLEGLVQCQALAYDLLFEERVHDNTCEASLFDAAEVVDFLESGEADATRGFLSLSPGKLW